MDHAIKPVPLTTAERIRKIAGQRNFALHDVFPAR
jgi:hypothetical protein